MSDYSAVHEDPANDYERALDRAGLACSWYGCWSPAAVLELNKLGDTVPCCAAHISSESVIVEVLER